MKHRLTTLFLTFARTGLGGRLAAWYLSHMGFAIPFRRLCETPDLLAFHHPSPSYAFHVLILPRRYIASIEEIAPGDSSFLVEVFSVSQALADEYHLERTGYHLVVNGGKYQEFPWLHFHLISDANLTLPDPLDLPGELFA